MYFHSFVQDQQKLITQKENLDKTNGMTKAVTPFTNMV